jgi:amino acid transporter
LAAQGAITLALVISLGPETNAFERLVVFCGPAVWFFMLLVGVSLFVLRYREPDAPRPFRVPGYPLTPAIFCASTAFMVYSSVTYAWQVLPPKVAWPLLIVAGTGLGLSLLERAPANDARGA